jgi:hypothetical protein
MFQKKPVNAFGRQSEEYKYQELLTPYAWMEIRNIHEIP